MSANSKIEWTDHTFNPWIGCQAIGPGCDNCYAAAWANRYGRDFAERSRTKTWSEPMRWNAAHAEFFALHDRRQRVFCASLADVFDNAVDPQWRADLFELIEKTPNLDWQLLTKRIGNVERMVSEATDLIDYGEGWQSMWGQGVWPKNVWLGATIVNQEEADRDIPKLLEVPARVRFLSMEPLLGPVDLAQSMHAWRKATGIRFLQGRVPDLHWVIVGGESGPGARPMHPIWARSLRDQCAAAGVPFLFKQWGEWTDEDWGERAGYRDTAGVLPSGEFLLMSQGYSPPFDQHERLVAANYVRLDGRTLMDRVSKKASGRLLDGVEHNGFPEAYK